MNGLNETLQYYSVTLEALKGRSRSQKLVLARQDFQQQKHQKSFSQKEN